LWLFLFFNRIGEIILKLLLIIMILLVFSIPAYAAHPLITDDTGTQGKGKFQIEMLGQAGYDKDKSTDTTTKTATPNTILTCGAIETVDVMVGTTYQWIRTSGQGLVSNENGIGDAMIAVKWRFFERDGFSFAVKPVVNLPSGDWDRGMGNGKMSGSIYLIGTKELKPFAFHINGAYIRNENKLNQEVSLWHASFATEYEMIKNLKLVGNVGAQRNVVRGDNTPPVFILGGLIYSLTEKIDLDAGYKYGLTKPEVNHTVLAGITIKF
jgi:hypothetical protein